MSSSYRFGRRTPPSARRPVAWFAPSTLLHAAQELVASQDFLRNFDRRETFVRDGRVEMEVIDLARREAADNLIFDFIADTGDGGAATFAVAHAALRHEIHATDVNGRFVTLPEGELLILGGDLAYPGASPHDYQYRLLEMFEWARDPHSRFRRVGAHDVSTLSGPHKFVAAIPQNHDWFDSAATFCRV
ncbi:MAG: hypothetical protein FJY37_16085 [Betaproteobacteria bacterium]|nr:hypothetical protein [Betaproteobacteria bacterium]